MMFSYEKKTKKKTKTLPRSQNFHAFWEGFPKFKNSQLISPIQLLI